VEASAYHTPVLLHEVLECLRIRPEGSYLDGTLGGGGHAEAVLDRLGPGGRLIGLDADEEALTSSAARLERFGGKAVLVRANFRDMLHVVRELHQAPLDGILLDLGVSSHQLDDPARGFSFRADERLDMRMDRRQEADATAVVNTYDEQRLAELFRAYGEERQSRAIARAVVRTRALSPLRTTAELAAVVGRVAGPRHRLKTLARIFQALRIEVNGELESIRQALSDGIDLLAPGGRFVVIAYHSLEDRMVKEAFREAAATARRSGHVLAPDTPLVPRLRIITGKPVEAGNEEVEDNPRARSAKLRAAERT